MLQPSPSVSPVTRHRIELHRLTRHRLALHRLVLQPGSLCCPAVPSELTTLLGSGVAVCLWDPVRRAGGMAHFLLPQASRSAGGSRVGAVAIPALLAGMTRIGCRPDTLRAKVFGGAGLPPPDPTTQPVGAANVRLALHLLQQAGIPVIARRTGGPHHLLLRFQSGSGAIRVQPVPPPARATSHPRPWGQPGERSATAGLAAQPGRRSISAPQAASFCSTAS